MKRESLFITCYAVLLIIGGLIGYFTAGSLASIFMASGFAAILFVCSFFVHSGNKVAYDVAMGVVLCLLLFFGYRFFLTFKIAPAGIMTLISAALLGLLAVRRPS